MNETYITACPSRRKTPSCSVKSSFGVCTLIDYTNEYTTCSCNICSNTNTNSHRVLQSFKKSSEIQSFHFVSMTTYVFEDYVSKMKQANDDRIFKVLLLLLLFTFIIIIIIIIIKNSGKETIIIIISVIVIISY